VENNSNHTVMVVEDFRDARAMLKDALETKGYRVVEAADGWEAVGLATRNRPDLILMNMHLPVLDGVEAACLLREHGEFSDVPMIAITAHDSADSRADAADCGFDGYVTKPIDLDRLEPLIERLLKAD
jgi:CheY-like chemotaxis protein